MPSCVARGCSTRYDRRDPNGRLKLFPKKDLKRRQTWIDRVNRSDWLPTNFSGLCDKHFDRTQWETPRPDGKQKLKSSALPTVFCVDPHLYLDIISQEHAYCVQGYRQLYPDNQNCKESESYESPTESCHVKVEVEEDNNTNQVDWETYGKDSMEEIETVRIKEERLSDCEEGSSSAEDIQCTPDIVLFNSNQPKLDPIEMVECNQEEISANVLEPSNDPLAISAEDLEKNQKAPTFAHSKKFLFVTKDTKYVSSMQNIVRAEPLITTEQPMVKIDMKPPRLFKAKELILYRNSSSDPTKLPKLQIAPNSNFQSILLKPQIPSSKIPLVNSICLPNNQLSPLKLKLISSPECTTVPPLQPGAINSATKCSPVKLKLASPPECKTVNPLNLGAINSPTDPSSTGQKPTLKLSNIRKIKLISEPKYEPAPEFLRPKKILLKGSFKGINKFLSRNSSMKPLIGDKLHTLSKLQTSISKQVPKQSFPSNFLFGKNSRAVNLGKDMDPFERGGEEAVENESTSDGKRIKFISSPLSKLKNQSDVLSKSRFISQQIIKVLPNMRDNILKLKDMACSKKSVIILKPIAKPSSNEENRFEKSQETFMKRRVTNKTLYKCLVCKIIFLTYATLRLHMFSKHNTTDMSLSKLWQVLGTHGELNTRDKLKDCINVKWIEGNKQSDSKVKITQDGVGKCVLGQRRPKSNGQDLNSLKTENIKKQINIKKTQKLSSDFYLLPEKTSRLKEKVISRKRRRNKTFCEKESSEDVQEYKNDLIQIPNINALKKSDDEFIRLTKLVTILGKEEEAKSLDSSLIGTSGRLSDDSSTISARDSLCKLSDDSSTISARDSLCKLSDDSSTLSAPETFSELAKGQLEKFKENNTRRPISRNTKKELTSKQSALISRVTKTYKSENSKSYLGKQVKIEDKKNNFSKKFNLEKIKSNAKKTGKHEKTSKQPDIESVKSLTIERRSSRHKPKVKVEEDGIENNPLEKANHIENIKSKQMKNMRSTRTNLEIKRDDRVKRKPFNQTIVTKNKTKNIPPVVNRKKNKISQDSKSKTKHQDSLEFACSTCSERFAKRFELRKHVSTGHKVVKCFVCPKRDCSRRFESRRDMVKHSRIHKK